VTTVAAAAAAPLGQGRQQRGQEDVHPLMRLALAHAHQAQARVEMAVAR
jgi:hypothetical protein